MKAKILEPHYLLEPMTQATCFFIYSGPPARHGNVHSELGLPTIILNQENAPTVKSIGHCDKNSFSVSFFCSQMTLACVKLPKKSNEHISNVLLTVNSSSGMDKSDGYLHP